MKQCLSCGREFKDQLLYCPFDGKLLIIKAEPDQLLGAILDDKYRLEEKVGEGAMGKVYRSTHVFMSHTVAVKVLRRHLSSDHVALERFRREARAAALIHHPNAVAVTDFGVTKDTHIAYLVMEFVQGAELRELISQRRQMDYQESFLIVEQVCAALHAAHSKGIIHRDLKPDNIRVINSQSGIPQVKVMDFGIAKLKAFAETRELTQHGVIIGTPYYMSPEQCRGEELDPRSDVYSLGVILYEMLTGEVPFRAANPLGVALKHTGERPRPAGSLRAGMPDAIERVVMRALKKDRAERQQNAAEFAQEFEAALLASGLQLKRPGFRTPESSFPPRTPATMEASKPPVEKQPQIPPPQFGKSIFVEEARGGGLAGNIKEAGQNLLGRAAASSDPETSFFGRMTLGTALSRGITKKIIFAAAALIAVGLAVVLTIKLSSSSKDDLASKEKLPPPAPEGMVFVRGGSFTMGSESGDQRSRPRHVVTVEPFFLDANEVSNQHYHEFIQKTGYKSPPHWQDKKYLPGTAQLPVVNISWTDASEYAKWVGKRLPTEREWEYAARGNQDNLYPWGQGWSDHYANLRETSKNGPVTVGSFADGKSWCGANDLVGNVAEWVSDYYKPYPNAGGAYDLDVRMIRGGSFKNSKDEPLTTNRPSASLNARQMDVGFRCAKDAPK
jgi:serine/threonine-protein kinase